MAEELYILRFAHDFAECGGELTWLVIACLYGTRRRAQDPWADRNLLAFGLAHAKLFAVIKGKTERVAKGGELSLGGVSLGTFERKGS